VIDGEVGADPRELEALRRLGRRPRIGMRTPFATFQLPRTPMPMSRRVTPRAIPSPSSLRVIV